MNPESFILFEDDEYFAALEPSEQPPAHPIEPDLPDDEYNSPSPVIKSVQFLSLWQMAQFYNLQGVTSLSTESNEEQRETNKRTRDTATQNNQNILSIPSTVSQSSNEVNDLLVQNTMSCFHMTESGHCTEQQQWRWSN